MAGEKKWLWLSECREEVVRLRRTGRLSALYVCVEAKMGSKLWSMPQSFQESVTRGLPRPWVVKGGTWDE